MSSLSLGSGPSRSKGWGLRPLGVGRVVGSGGANRGVRRVCRYEWRRTPPTGPGSVGRPRPSVDSVETPVKLRDVKNVQRKVRTGRESSGVSLWGSGLVNVSIRKL